MTRSQRLRATFASWLEALRWQDALKVLLAFVLIGVVISRTDLHAIAALRQQISWPWLAASFALLASLTALKAVQYWALLNRGVPYGQVVRIVVIQNALTNLVTLAAGAASYMTMLRVEQNVKLSRSGIIFIITKAGDLFSMCLYLLISAIVVWGRVQALQPVVILLLAGAFFGLGVFWTLIFLRRSLVSGLDRLARRLRLDRIKVVASILDAMRSLVDLDHRMVARTVLTGLALSLCYMTVTMIYAYSTLRAFRVPLDAWAILFLTAIMQLISIIPIQAFGGLGVTEVTSLYLYDLFHVTGVDMAAIVVGMRVVFYLFNLGLLLYLPLLALRGRGSPRAQT